MAISEKIIYDVTPQTFIDQYCDPDYLTKLYTALKADNIDVYRCDKSEGRVSMGIARDVPVEVPSFAKKFISPMSSIDHQVEFVTQGDGSIEADYKVVIKGMPVSCTGKVFLRPRPGGKTEHEVTAHIEAKIPIVGKKIADFLGKDTAAVIIEEQQYNQANIG